MLLGSHVLAGALSLVTGLAALAWGRKGGRAHRLFGFFSIQAALVDIRTFLGRSAMPPRWWLFHHIQAMIGSFIAAVTAFLVQNGPRLSGHPDIQWIFWVTPTLLGVIYINLMVARYRGKLEGKPGE